MLGEKLSDHLVPGVKPVAAGGSKKGGARGAKKDGTPQCATVFDPHLGKRGVKTNLVLPPQLVQQFWGLNLTILTTPIFVTLHFYKKKRHLRWM